MPFSQERGPRARGLASLTVGPEPGLHHLDLALLGFDDPLCQFAQLRILRVFELDLGHVDRTLVMRDHAAHEIDIGVAAFFPSPPRMPEWKGFPPP